MSFFLDYVTHGRSPPLPAKVRGHPGEMQSFNGADKAQMRVKKHSFSNVLGGN